MITLLVSLLGFAAEIAKARKNPNAATIIKALEPAITAGVPAVQQFLADKKNADAAGMTLVEFNAKFDRAIRSGLEAGDEAAARNERIRQEEAAKAQD